MKLPLLLILIGSAFPVLAADPDAFAPQALTLDVGQPKLKAAPMLAFTPVDQWDPATVVVTSGVAVPLPVGSVRFEARPIPAGVRGHLDAPGPGYRTQKEKTLGK